MDTYKKKIALCFVIAALLLFVTGSSSAQHMAAFADSIRIVYKIPGLSYAVVSADSVYDIQALGVRKINTQYTATLNDRYRIGSNTKAITGYIAALLVKEGKISWNTKFFDLFPELQITSRREYRELTLLNLLTFRTKLFPYTYTDVVPVKGQFTGDESMQRYHFAEWFFQQPPVKKKDSICFSNLGYVAAGLMLERASGKPYKQLVTDLGKQLGIQFDFGAPNKADSLQTWGHNAALVPEAPADDYKLEWLLAAGNINATLPDYVKFIQLQLQGLKGKSDRLTRDDFYFLHYGLRRFSLGWFQDKDAADRAFSYNFGNPGSFLTKVYVFKEQDKAFILFCNAQTDSADLGLNIIFEELKRRYGM